LGCGEQTPEKVEQPTREELAAKPAEQTLTVCVGAVITPKKGLIYYQDMLNYISNKMGRQIKYVDKTTYAEINDMLKAGQVDVAFVCAQPYVDGHNEFGLELLVAPEVNGEPVYYSYIIVPQNSPVKSFAELRGKRFAFTDPDSNSGKLVPTYMLSKMGETPESFFKETIFSYAHDKSIQLVANGLVDGAAVDSLIWEYSYHFNPEYTSKTKVIEKSPPYGIPPVVVRPDLDLKTKSRLRQLFLNIHLDTEGKNILKNMLIDRFVTIEDSHYNSIREMQAYIKQQQAGKK
jgi:phosphonate transport system substrate-binding protein